MAAAALVVDRLHGDRIAIVAGHAVHVGVDEAVHAPQRMNVRFVMNGDSAQGREIATARRLHRRHCARRQRVRTSEAGRRIVRIRQHVVDARGIARVDLVGRGERRQPVVLERQVDAHRTSDAAHDPGARVGHGFANDIGEQERRWRRGTRRRRSARPGFTEFVMP